MMMPQRFAPSFPAQSYPGPSPGAQFISQPSQENAAVQPWRGGNPAVAQQQTRPRQVVRAQMGDEPESRPSPVASRPVARAIPSPEELGVTSAKPAEKPGVDWTAVHSRLDQLGATCFQVERLAEGGCRITCLLPTAEQGRTHRIEAEAPNEADATRATLAKAEEWAAAR